MNNNKIVYWPPPSRSPTPSSKSPVNELIQNSNAIYDNLDNESLGYFREPAAADTHNFNTRETFTKNIKQLQPNQWPPQSNVMGTAEIANKQRINLTRSPVCRPRKIDRDREYGSFFAKNKINNYYSTYRAPPGTQHYNNQTEFSDL